MKSKYNKVEIQNRLPISIKMNDFDPMIRILLTKIHFIFNLIFFVEPNLRDWTQVTVAVLEIQLPFYTSDLSYKRASEGQQVNILSVSFPKRLSCTIFATCKCTCR